MHTTGDFKRLYHHLLAVLCEHGGEAIYKAASKFVFADHITIGGVRPGPRTIIAIGRGARYRGGSRFSSGVVITAPDGRRTTFDVLISLPGLERLLKLALDRLDVTERQRFLADLDTRIDALVGPLRFTRVRFEAAVQTADDSIAFCCSCSGGRRGVAIHASVPQPTFRYDTAAWEQNYCFQSGGQGWVNDAVIQRIDAHNAALGLAQIDAPASGVTVVRCQVTHELRLIFEYRSSVFNAQTMTANGWRWSNRYQGWKRDLDADAEAALAATLAALQATV